MRPLWRRSLRGTRRPVGDVRVQPDRQNRVGGIQWLRLGPAACQAAGPPADILREVLRRCTSLAAMLADAAEAGEPILLVINDPFRTTQSRAALRSLGEMRAGLPQSPRFEVLVATGTHRIPAAEQREFERTTLHDCGLSIASVAWHDSRADADHAPVAGVRLNHRVVAARRLLGIGSVEPHYFAGLTGAHKTLTIGCMGHADIEANHAGALEPASELLRLRGNPVHDSIVRVLDGLKAAGKQIVAINQVVCGAELIAAAAGDPLETLDALVDTARRVYVHRLDRPVDVLHLRVPPPLGRNLYQADKALKNNHLAVRDGGGIVLEADCEEGVGPDAFLGLLRRAPDYATAREIVAREGYRLGDHKAVKLRHLTDPAQRGVHVALAARNVAVADAQAAGLRLFDSPGPALDSLAGEIRGPLERGLIVEDAGVTSVVGG
jgi:nickel-dependent lactate racemase